MHIFVSSIYGCQTAPYYKTVPTEWYLFICLYLPTIAAATFNIFNGNSVHKLSPKLKDQVR